MVSRGCLILKGRGLFAERQPLGVQFSHDLRWYFEMFYWCFTALPKALWQLCLWFMPVSLKYPTLVKNLGKTKKTKQKTRKTKTPILLDSLEGRGGPAKTLWKEGNTLEKPKKKNISILFGRGGSQPRLSENCFFFLFPVFFWFWSLSAICTFLHWPFGVFMRSNLQEPIV